MTPSPAPPPRDPDREALYEAEDHAFLHTTYADQVGVAALDQLAARLRATAWWVDCGVDFQVVPTRREARSSFAVVHADGRRQVRVALGAESVTVLAHEAAHLLASRWAAAEASHGPRYRAALCDVAAVLLGHAGFDRLARALEAQRLVVGSRRWSAPDPRSLTTRGLFGEWLLDLRASSL